MTVYILGRRQKKHISSCPCWYQTSIQVFQMISNPDGGCQLFVNIIGTVYINNKIDHSIKVVLKSTSLLFLMDKKNRLGYDYKMETTFCRCLSYLRKEMIIFMSFKLRCDERFTLTHAFTACGSIFKEITLFGSNQGN